MTGTEALEPSIVAIELWALTMARCMGIGLQAPIFGSRHITMRARVGSVLVIATALYPTLPMPQGLTANFPQHLGIIFSNIMVGLIVGFAASLTMYTIQFAGELVDTQLGLSTAASFDPSAGGTVNMIRRFKFYLAMMVYLIINGHHSLIIAIYRSFQAVPADAMFVPRGALIADFVSMTNDMLFLGVQIASPCMAALYIVQMALGLVARAAPQMNVFMLSFPVNILVGTTVLSAAIPYIAKKLIFIFDDNYMSILKMLLLMKPGG